MEAQKRGNSLSYLFFVFFCFFAQGVDLEADTKTEAKVQTEMGSKSGEKQTEKKNSAAEVMTKTPLALVKNPAAKTQKNPAKNSPSLALDFDVQKKQSSNAFPTLLLIAGIQGDEPGGFNAANIFLMHYEIKKGEVWVVPAINKHSILRNHRGIYDDMNRKFAALDKNDPEYPIIRHIKSLITDPSVDAVLHLHDGSGFYRPTYIDPNKNPNRWGSCSIIDQEVVTNAKFPELGKITDHVIKHINAHLLSPEHRYYKRDTKTAKGDVEMEKALTFFAIKNKKSAFANEASKNLSLEKRVYYHLLAIEGLLGQLGIEFRRDFELTPQSLYHLINDTHLDVRIAKSITLPLYGLREELNYFPLPKQSISSIPLESRAHILGLLQKDNQVLLKYGNKVMTKFSPEYLDFDDSLQTLKIQVDGKTKEVKIGSIIPVKQNFEILDLPGYRANIIGFVSPKDRSDKPNEMGILISKKECTPRFSIDKKGKIYRAEFYKGDAFSGMLLFRFQDRIN